MFSIKGGRPRLHRRRVVWTVTSGLTCALVMFAVAPVSVAQGQDATEPSNDVAHGDGEECIACQTAITGPIQTVLYEGRRVHLHQGHCVDDWLGNTDTLFARLEARGALYDEHAVRGSGLGPGWLFFGVYVLAGLVFGAACSYLALGRGMNAVQWFALGFVFNIGALIGVMLRGGGDTSAYPSGIPPGLRKIPMTRMPRSCDCGAPNHPSARICSACGSALTTSIQSEVARI